MILFFSTLRHTCLKISVICQNDWLKLCSASRMVKVCRSAQKSLPNVETEDTFEKINKDEMHLLATSSFFRKWKIHHRFALRPPSSRINNIRPASNSIMICPNTIKIFSNDITNLSIDATRIYSSSCMARKNVNGGVSSSVVVCDTSDQRPLHRAWHYFI